MPANRLAIDATINDKVSGPLARMRDKFDQLGKSKGAQSILQGVGVGVGIKAMGLLSGAIGGITDTISGSIDKASDLNETISKSNVVFGASGAEMLKWGDSAASSMGLSKQAALEAAATFGNLFEGAGLAQKGAADLSKGVVGLAADLASFNNIPTAEALQKLQSGLVGEAEPLRQLGVNLTAASTDAQAAAMGFTKVNGVYTEGDKILARYQLILKSTGNAQGDFARTSDGLANKQKILNAQWDDMQAKIGEKLLPVLTELAAKASAAFDILDNTKHAQALVDQTKAFTSAGYSTDTYAKALAGTREQLAEMVNSGKATEAEIKALYDVTVLLEAATKLQTGTMATAASGFGGYHNAMTDARPGIESVHGSLSDMNEAILESKINSYEATKPVHEFFDKFTIAASKGDIAQDTLDIQKNNQAVRDARKAVEEATPGTAAYKTAQLELTVALGDLATSQEKLIDDQMTLFAQKPDKATALKLEKYFQDLGLDVQNLSGDALTAYQNVQKLLHPFIGKNKIDINIRVGTSQRNIDLDGSAEGGWVGLHGPEVRMVGEKGPEYVIPNNQLGILASNGGSPVTLNIAMDGQVVARVVDQRLYYDYSRASPSAGRK